jgi:hypothetical protein
VYPAPQLVEPQAQLPATHMATPVQTLPQAPQFCSSSCVFRQVPLQQVWLAPQAAPPPHLQVVPSQTLPFVHGGLQVVGTQVPPVHTLPGGQAGAPQLPQWSVPSLFITSRQPSAQQLCVPTHTVVPPHLHTPPLHCSPVRHEVVQLPQ